MPALRALLSQKQLSCGRCAGAGASACGRWARCAPMSLCWRVCTYVCTYVGTGTATQQFPAFCGIGGGGLEFIEHQGRVAFLLLPGLLQGPSWHRRQAAAWPWGVSVCASCHPLRPHPGSEVHCAPPSLPASPRRCCQRPPHVWTCVLAQPSRPRTCSDFCARLSRRALVTPLGRPPCRVVCPREHTGLSRFLRGWPFGLPVWAPFSKSPERSWRACACSCLGYGGGAAG